MEKKGQKKRRQTKAKIAEAGFAFWLIRLICSRCRLRFPTPSPPPALPHQWQAFFLAGDVIAIVYV